MAYVAVKGGEQAIDAAHAWLAETRRGDPAIAELGPEQIASQLGRAVDRVMAEGSLFDPALAALAIKQSQGDLIEAAFLLRAYRTTLPRLRAQSQPVETAADARVHRRVSAIFKDMPGGQLLGPTYRLHAPSAGFRRLPPKRLPAAGHESRGGGRARCRTVFGAFWLREDLVEPDAPDDGCGARRPDAASRCRSRPGGTCGCRRWRGATRGSCWRWAIRRSGATATRTPSWASCAIGDTVAVVLVPPELGFAIDIGDVTRDGVPDGEPVPAVRAPCRRSSRVAMGCVSGRASAESDGDGAGGPRAAGRGAGRTGWSTARRRTWSSCCIHSRQRGGDRVRRAPEAAALRGLPERSWKPSAACVAGGPPVAEMGECSKRWERRLSRPHPTLSPRERAFQNDGL